MENEVTQPPKSTSKVMPIAVVIAVVVIILVSVAAFSMSKKPDAMIPESPAAQESAPTPTTAAMIESSYKDGIYEAEGEYTSPGGAESIDVSLTLKNGVIEDATITSNATRPISRQMQSSFIEGYKEVVIGKNIDDLNLTKVSKSSLTPKGFNDAVAKIKAEAKA